MTRIPFFLALALIMATASCRTRRPVTEPGKLVPFTHQLREKYQLSDATLRNLQYYLAGEMILRREMRRDEATVTRGHQIRIINDRRVEEVQFKQLTPGVAEVVRPESMDVSFETGGRLTFGSSPKSRERYSGRYVLFAKDWKDNQARLHYQGKEYYTYGLSSGFYLLVDMKELRKFKKETRTVKGRRLETR